MNLLNEVWVIALVALVSVSGQWEFNQLAKKLHTIKQADEDGFLRTLSLAEHKIQFVRLLEAGNVDGRTQLTTTAPETNEGLIDQELVSDECGAGLGFFLEGLAQSQPWATQMLDATAKPPSGILDGALTWPGLYTKCMNIRTNQTAEGGIFSAHYCAASLSSTQNITTAMSVQISAGLCLPESCSEEDVLLVTKSILSNLPRIPLQATAVQCSPKGPLPLDAPAIVMITILSIITALVLSSTIYDLLFYKRGLTKAITSGEFQSISASNLEGSSPGHSSASNGVKPSHVPRNYGSTRISVSLEQELHNDSFNEKNDTATILPENQRQSYPILQKPKQNKGLPSKAVLCFLAFSAYTNGSKILTVSGLSKDRALAPIHGIRVISMTWIILAHTFVFGLWNSSIGNMAVLFDFSKDFTFQAILNASVSVDTFFLLSGTLLSYLLLNEMDKKGSALSIPWHKIYFHRFWRLTPPYMLVIGTYTALYSYLGQGPFWQSDSDVVQMCRSNWWINLLYVNNIVKPMEMCLGWSWYLANDMQFFLISPIFLIPLFLKPTLSFILMALTALASMVSIAILTLQNDLPFAVPSLLTSADLSKLTDWMTLVYMPPWARIGPYLIGIGLGYALYSTSNSARKHNQAYAFIGWAVATVCCSSVVYGLYGYTMGDDLSTAGQVLYAAVFRNVWSIGVAWVIFACCRGCGGFVNKFLSWPALVPLSRLTFMAYLLHPIVIIWFFQSQETLLYLSYINLTWWFLSFVVTSYAAAFVFSLLFEAPMIALEKVLLA